MADYNEVTQAPPPDPQVEVQAVIDFLNSLTEVRSLLLSRLTTNELDFVCLINRPIAPELRSTFSGLETFGSLGLDNKGQFVARLKTTNARISIDFLQISELKNLISSYFEANCPSELLLAAHQAISSLKDARLIIDKKEECALLLKSIEAPLPIETRVARMKTLCEKFYPLDGGFAKSLVYAWEKDNIPHSIEILYHFLRHFFLAVFTLNDAWVPANKNWIDYAQKELTSLPSDTTALVHDLVLALGQLPDASKKAQNIVDKLSRNIIELAASKGLLQTEGA